MNKTTLHWSYLNFKDVPMDLFLYEDLEEVYLKENFITTIPKWLLNVTTLKFIHLAGNNLSAIPEEMYLLENLEFLDVSNNQIRELPKTIGLIDRLQRFNISGNELTELPAGIILHVEGKTEDKSLCLLNATATEPSAKPWPIIFSFDGTLQSSIMIAWAGHKKNVEKAQNEFLKMLSAFSKAAQGSYVTGSMKSLADQCYCKKALKALKTKPDPLPNDCVKFEEICRPPPVGPMTAKPFEISAAFMAIEIKSEVVLEENVIADQEIKANEVVENPPPPISPSENPVPETANVKRASRASFSSVTGERRRSSAAKGT